MALRQAWALHLTSVIKVRTLRIPQQHVQHHCHMAAPAPTCGATVHVLEQEPKSDTNALSHSIDKSQPVGQHRPARSQRARGAELMRRHIRRTEHL